MRPDRRAEVKGRCPVSLGSDNANWSMERLVEIRELKDKVADLETEIHELLEENERLRKAGDAVIEKLAEAYAGEPSDFDHAHVFKAWLAAKGVQP
jgi:hypothetical protein